MRDDYHAKKNKKKSPMWEECLRSFTCTDSRHQARLFVFEDNDAVIKKIIKGRRPRRRDTFPPNASRRARLVV